MLKLYHAKFTRSFRVLWLLEELGLPYEVKTLDFRAREHKSPAYLAVNPMGKLPAIEDGAVRMSESGAIIQYILETYGEGRLEPKPGTPERPVFLQWMHWPETAMVALGLLAAHTVLLPEENRDPKIAAWGAETWRDYASVLEAHLDGREYVTGAEFTAADVMLGYNLMVASLFRELPDSLTRVTEYYERLSARPAYQKASGL